MGAYPQFVDWNNDGKKDLICGDADGKVWLFLNTGTEKNPVLAEGVLLKSAGKPIAGVPPKYESQADGTYRRVPNTTDVMGVYSKIHVGDWDGDGLKDLLVGQDGPGGQDLVWYKNIGTASAPVLDKPLPIKLPGAHIGRPSPYLVDWDGDGKQDLLIGSENGEVWFFRNIGTKQKPELAEGKKLELKFKGSEGKGTEPRQHVTGYRWRLDVVDWNNDGKLDLLIGNIYSDDKTSGGNIWLFLGK